MLGRHSRVNVTGLLRRLQVKIEYIYLFKIILKTWRRLLKLALPKFSRAAQKICVAQNLGGAAAPLAPPARTPIPDTRSDH